jgi:CheY-like chemotaxis protein
MNAIVRRILLVEDSPNDAELTLGELGKHMHPDHIQHVKDGEEALDYLLRRGRYASRGDGNPLVVLLDLKLPKVSGLEVLRSRAIRSCARHRWSSSPRRGRSGTSSRATSSA